jgi:hypothetical protein
MISSGAEGGEMRFVGALFLLISPWVYSKTDPCMPNLEGMKLICEGELDPKSSPRFLPLMKWVFSIHSVAPSNPVVCSTKPNSPVTVVVRGSFLHNKRSGYQLYQDAYIRWGSNESGLYEDRRDVMCNRKEEDRRQSAMFVNNQCLKPAATPLCMPGDIDPRTKRKNLDRGGTYVFSTQSDAQGRVVVTMTDKKWEDNKPNKKDPFIVYIYAPPEAGTDPLLASDLIQ